MEVLIPLKMNAIKQYYNSDYVLNGQPFFTFDCSKQAKVWYEFRHWYICGMKSAEHESHFIPEVL